MTYILGRKMEYGCLAYFSTYKCNAFTSCIKIPLDILSLHSKSINVHVFFQIHHNESKCLPSGFQAFWSTATNV